MDTVDITPTPEACHQIARLFRALKADAEALATRAEHALDALDATDDDILALWGRALLATAFAALHDAARARPAHGRRIGGVRPLRRRHRRGGLRRCGLTAPPRRAAPASTRRCVASNARSSPRPAASAGSSPTHTRSRRRSSAAPAARPRSPRPARSPCGSCARACAGPCPRAPRRSPARASAGCSAAGTTRPCARRHAHHRPPGQ